jgi:hypothetical protein
MLFRTESGGAAWLSQRVVREGIHRKNFGRRLHVLGWTLKLDRLPSQTKISQKNESAVNRFRWPARNWKDHFGSQTG